MKNIEKRKIIIKGQSLGKSTELPLIAFGKPAIEIIAVLNGGAQ
ncbi:hypothetical protein AB7W11_19125 [Providencia manganoxydans]